MQTKTRCIQFSCSRLPLAAVPLAVIVSMFMASPAGAVGPPIAASGSYQQLSFVPSNFRTADGVTFFDFTEHDSLSGTFTGTSVIEGSCMTGRSGATTCMALETFTGTVSGQGRPGDTAVSHDVVRIDPTGTIHGTFTFLRGTGALANLHGHGTFQGTTTGSYTAVLVFAP